MYFDATLWQATMGLRGRIVAAIGLGLLALAAGIARFACLGWLLALVFQGEPAGSLALPAASVAACILLRAGLDHARAAIAHRTAARIQEALRDRLFAKIFALGPDWFAGQRTGGVMLSMVDGVEQLQTFFGQYLPQLCIAALAPFAIFGFMMWWDVPVASVLLVAAIVTLLVPMMFHRLDRRASLARQAAFKAFGEEFLDAVQGLPTLKALGQSGAFGRRLAERARALADTTIWVLSTGLMTRGITDVGIAVGASAALVLGAWRVSDGDMTLQALLVVLMAGTEIFRPLRDLRTVLHQGMVGQAAAAGIKALLAEPEPDDGAATGADTAGLEPSIEFDDVRFGYAGVRGLAHRGLSFRAAPGERIGIVGPSGAGKSTIVRLLLRFGVPEGGAVRIGGRDTRTLRPEAVRDLVSVVQQDAVLFHGTIEDNLRLARPAATMEEIEAAARAANAHDFISALPEGYRTVVGERGAGLSGGQRQRIAIARALLKDAPILVLDEALSSVDAENELLITGALERLMEGRTTLTLAHRLSSVIDADRIVVLDGGRVVQSGTHRELIDRPGPYRQLMAAQAEEARIEEIAGPEAGAPEPEAPAHAAGAPASGTAAPAREGAAASGALSTLLALLGFIRPWRRQLAATVASAVGRVTTFIGVGVIGALIVAAVRHGESVPWVLVAALFVAAPLAGLLHWWESLLAHDMAYRLLAQMRIDLFAQLDRLAPAYLMRRRTGDLVGLATQDVETIEYFYAHTVAPAIIAVLVPAVVITTLAVLAWPLALGLLPFLAAAALAPIVGRGRVDRLGAEARRRLGGLAARVTDGIQGMSDLFAFRAVERYRTAFVERVRAYQTVRVALLTGLSGQAALIEALTGFGGLVVAVLGARLVAAGSLDAGLLPLLVLVSVAAFLPISEIGEVGRQLADTIASTKRLQAVHGEPVAITDGDLAPPLPEGGSAVAFEDVSFAYPGAPRAALTSVTFTAEPGTTVAIVGPSGAGKTTLAHLLLRFWDPAGGRIRIDGTELPRFELDALRRRIALVAQDTYLFDGTIRSNVMLARPEATEEDLRRALARAALDGFVGALPEGLETRVGERGLQLSGGQRQRIAIARAFLRNAPILILDEATSHLDAISEQRVHEALASLMADRTTFVIAHRLSTVRAADRIVVLDRGRIAEAGRHGELLARGGVYARLVSHQLAAAARPPAA